MVNTMAKSNGNNATQVNHRAYYGTVWPNWQVKALGPQPTNEQLGIIHGLKARPGKQALANAMALRDGGVTGAQIKNAVALIDGGSNPQLNKMRALVSAGMLAWVPMPVTGEGKVYRTKLTPLGAQMVKANSGSTVHVTPTLKAKAPAGNGKPAKAPAGAKGAAKAKPRTPKPAAEKPAGGPAKVTPGQVTSDKPQPARQVLTEAGPKPLTPQQAGKPGEPVKPATGEGKPQ